MKTERTYIRECTVEQREHLGRAKMSDKERIVELEDRVALLEQVLIAHGMLPKRPPKPSEPGF